MQGFQLQPGSQFPITRRLADPSDLTVYYIQAVIRKLPELTVLDTVKLTSQGSGLWMKVWEVPQDPSGAGLYLEISTTVYTDSGYSNSTTPYQVESNTHLILDRLLGGLLHGGGGMGGGADVDYKRIGKIVATEVAKVPVAKEPKEPKEVDLQPVLDGHKAIMDAVKGIKMPQYEPTNLSSLTSQIQALQGMVKALPTPADYQPSLDQLETGLHDLVQSDAHKQVGELLDSIKSFFLNDMQDIQSKFDKITSILSKPLRVIVGAEGQQPEDPAAGPMPEPQEDQSMPQ